MNLDQGKGSKTTFQSYGQYADRIGPQVRDALEGKIKVSRQQPSTEAWIAYALYWGGSQLSLEGVVYNADVVSHSIPNAEEIAWALMSLRSRKWLSAQKNSYGLTVEGRRMIESVVGNRNLRESMERLEEWIFAHPPPSAE